MPRKSYTVKKKLELIRRIESGETLEKVSRDEHIDRRCLQRWRKDKPKFLEVALQNRGAQTRYIRRAVNYAKYTELETGLADRVRTTRKQSKMPKHKPFTAIKNRGARQRILTDSVFAQLDELGFSKLRRKDEFFIMSDTEITVTHQFRVCEDGSVVGTVNDRAILLTPKDSTEVMKFLDILVNRRPCSGNADEKFQYMDRDSVYSPNCQVFLEESQPQSSIRCTKCSVYRNSLRVRFCQSKKRKVVDRVDYIAQLPEQSSQSQPVSEQLSELKYEELLKRAISLSKEVIVHTEAIHDLRNQLDQYTSEIGGNGEGDEQECTSMTFRSLNFGCSTNSVLPVINWSSIDSQLSELQYETGPTNQPCYELEEVKVEPSEILSVQQEVKIEPG